MSSVAIMADVYLKRGNAITRMIVGTVATKRGAFIHPVHQVNLLVPIIVAFRNPRCATASTIVKTTLRPMRRTSVVLAILHVR